MDLIIPMLWFYMRVASKRSEKERRVHIYMREKVMFQVATKEQKMNAGR
jgi:hypothetical protein